MPSTPLDAADTATCQLLQRAPGSSVACADYVRMVKAGSDTAEAKVARQQKKRSTCCTAAFDLCLAGRVGGGRVLLRLGLLGCGALSGGWRAAVRRCRDCRLRLTRLLQAGGLGGFRAGCGVGGGRCAVCPGRGLPWREGRP